MSPHPWLLHHCRPLYPATQRVVTPTSCRLLRWSTHRYLSPTTGQVALGRRRIATLCAGIAGQASCHAREDACSRLGIRPNLSTTAVGISILITFARLNRGAPFNVNILRSTWIPGRPFDAPTGASWGHIMSNTVAVTAHSMAFGMADLIFLGFGHQRLKLTECELRL